MRPIHLARLDKTRPVVILTRERVLHLLTSVTVAPITSTVRGIAVEIPVGSRNGLDHDSVINIDNVATIDTKNLGRQIGRLYPDQEALLARAIVLAFDLETVAPAGRPTE